MKYPLFSVIVPVYNCQNVLDRCLDSITSQIETNIEVIVVDDGSVDNSWQKMKQYADKDKRIKIFRQENKGVSAARNYALDKAKGDYITFVDADDYLEKNYISELYGAICEYNADISLCAFVRESIDGKIISEQKEKDNVPVCFSVHKGYSYQSGTAQTGIAGALYKKEVLQEIRFLDDLYVGEDVLFFAEAAKKSGNIVRIYKELYHYVVYLSSACHGDFDEKKFTELESWNRVCDLFQDNLEVYCSAKCAYIIRCYGMIRNYYKNQDFNERYYHYVLKEFRINMRWFYKSKEFSIIKKVIRTFYAICPWVIKLDKRR